MASRRQTVAPMAPARSDDEELCRRVRALCPKMPLTVKQLRQISSNASTVTRILSTILQERVLLLPKPADPLDMFDSNNLLSHLIKKLDESEQVLAPVVGQLHSGLDVDYLLPALLEYYAAKAGRPNQQLFDWSDFIQKPNVPSAGGSGKAGSNPSAAAYTGKVAGNLREAVELTCILAECVAYVEPVVEEVAQRVRAEQNELAVVHSKIQELKKAKIALERMHEANGPEIARLLKSNAETEKRVEAKYEERERLKNRLEQANAKREKADGNCSNVVRIIRLFYNKVNAFA